MQRTGIWQERPQRLQGVCIACQEGALVLKHAVPCRCCRPHIRLARRYPALGLDAPASRHGFQLEVTDDVKKPIQHLSERVCWQETRYCFAS